MSAMAALLEMRGIEKRFGGVRALSGVDLDLRAGEVVVVAGENGAGKSTLMRIAAGLLAPDAGTIRVEGRSVRFGGPRDALAAGVSIVTQEGTLAPDLSVAENLLLGREPRRGPFVDAARMAAQARAMLAQLGVEQALAPGARVAALGVAARQLVEIARAIGVGGRILILDEPTASLSEAEVPKLFAAVRRLVQRGVGVLYISHRLEEFAQIGDRVLVLRGGERVFEAPLAEAPVGRIVEQMAGRGAAELFPDRAPGPGPDAPALLELRGVSAGPLERVDLMVRRGEILGVAGLVGSGRSALLRAAFGALRLRAGEVRIDGRLVALRSPADAVRAGVGLVPEDRKLEALALERSVTHNVTLAALDRFRGGLRVDLDLARERDEVGALARSLALQCRGLDQRAAELSGGNQQKAVVARWLCRDSRVLLCDEPTRGVDVGARADLFRLLARLAREGRAVVIVSSALPELIGLCHRIAVMHRGRVVSDAVNPAEVDEHQLVHLMSLGALAAGNRMPA